MTEAVQEQISRFKPTDVQLQVWDDLCHVAPTLSFTRPAKYMYRSIAQFGAWALARAQKTEIEILDDDAISVISSSGSDSEEPIPPGKKEAELPKAEQSQVGKAGDPLPPFKNHMIRQRVSQHGVIRPLEPAAQLPSCIMHPNEIGVVKEGPVRKWLEARRQWDSRFSNARSKVHKKRLKEMLAGYQGFDGETPPPSALAARRKAGSDLAVKAKRKSMGLALWSLWGSKHDEMTVQREEQAEKAPEVKITTTQEGHGARSPSDLEKQARDVAGQRPSTARSRSRTKVVRDEHQTAENGVDDANTPIALLMAKREGRVPQDATELPSASNNDSLTPHYVPPSTGVAGKRPIVGGIAVPFSLDREAETASMITLTSTMDQSMRVASPISLGPEMDEWPGTSAAAAAVVARSRAGVPGDAVETGSTKARDGEEDASSELGTPMPFVTPLPLAGEERPPLETFVTAREDLPKAQ